MSKLDLTNLKPGDVLVCRDGTRREFSHRYRNGRIDGGLFERPSVWSADGKHENGGRKWDIVRVIRRRPAAKKRDDKDAVWLLEHVNYFIHHKFNYGCDDPAHRIRLIARRLNGGRKVGA